jgi:proline iminopeptidase
LTGDRRLAALAPQVGITRDPKGNGSALGWRTTCEDTTRLHEITVKALTIGARYDEMDPEDMKKMAGLMQNASYAFCPNGSHLCM